MSTIRAYYIWQTVESSDKSYIFASLGLWNDGEISAGIIVGCFPVMPKFFQHVGLKFHGAFPSWPKSVRSKTAKRDALVTIESPFSKNRTGPSVPESSNGPHAQLHGQHYALNNLKGPRSQEAVLVGVKSCHENDLDDGHARS